MMREPASSVVLTIAACVYHPWKQFKEGMVPSITNGALVELNYVLGREAPGGPLGPGGALVGNLAGRIDGFEPTTYTVHGWAVDSALAGRGRGPVTIVLSVDGAPVLSVLAKQRRPDLVPAGVAPNAEHGFEVVLPVDAAKTLLGAGQHVLSARVVGSPSTVVPATLPERSEIICQAGVCA